MPVQDFECQIARGQIGRYLNGEGLSSEALRQLGAHVAECTECKSFLDHRKAALQGMLGERDMPEHTDVRAVVDVKPSEALIAQIRARTVDEDPEPEPQSHSQHPTKPLLTKPIIYCGVLALVLVGMTYISRNPAGLLGPKASEVVATNTSSKPKADPAPPTSTLLKPPVNTAVVDTKAPSPLAGSAVGDAKAPSPLAADAKTPSPPARSAAGTSPEWRGDAGLGKTPSPLASDAKAPSPLAADAARTSPEGRGDAGSAKTPSPLAADAARTSPEGRGDAAAPRKKWHRKPAAKHHWSLHHLKPGTGAVHVYRS
ncbi:MAG TPA: hypothetical protein VKT78_09185 [Fimbriimonadaceae bacterium]|nr:hypothetical protein [Fimbriimonadaceae bacterium]